MSALTVEYLNRQPNGYERFINNVMAAHHNTFKMCYVFEAYIAGGNMIDAVKQFAGELAWHQRTESNVSNDELERVGKNFKPNANTTTVLITNLLELELERRLTEPAEPGNSDYLNPLLACDNFETMLFVYVMCKAIVANYVFMRPIEPEMSSGQFPAELAKISFAIDEYITLVSKPARV